MKTLGIVAMVLTGAWLSASPARADEAKKDIVSTAVGAGNFKTLATALEKAGLVRRTPHPSDRRATLIELTDEGRALAIQATEKLNTEVFARPGIPEEHIDTLLRIIATMRHDAGDFDTGGVPSKW